MPDVPEPRDVPPSRSGPVARVAIGYLGGSWVVLQVVEVVSGLIALPSWVGPAAILVLLAGFVMVVGTAWVQADPATTRKEEAGEVPTDWQVAPAEAWHDLLRGRLPHLTWGRTLLGGVVGVSLLIGAAGAWVLLDRRGVETDDSALEVFGDDADSDRDPAVTRLAVLPFTTSGGDLAVYEEGMVELLSTNLDGLGGLRATDSRTVLARWDEVVGTDGRPDLDTTLRAAAATGARHALVGSMVAAGGSLRLNGRLYQIEGAQSVGDVQVEGPPDETLALVDRFSVEVVRALIGSADDLGETGLRLASLTTSSIPALERYLTAESFYRRGEFEAALPPLDEAVEADTMFGLAVVRRAQTFGWVPAVHPDTLALARLRIGNVLDRLSPRDAVLAEGGIIDFADRDPNGVVLLREFVQRYPDEAEGWYQLSDFLFHLNDVRGGLREEVLGGFDQAVRLGPRFAPYYIHAVEGALMRADSARARELIDSFEQIGGEPTRVEHWRVALGYLFPAMILPESSSIPLARLELGTVFALLHSDRPQVLADRVEVGEHSPWIAEGFLLRAGRWSIVPDPSGPGAVAPELPFHRPTAESWLGLFELDPADGHLPLRTLTLRPEWHASGDEATALLASMLAARDDGTGADPLLLAHIAERAGDRPLAIRLFEEESWREAGPAAIYRLARLLEVEGRAAEALARYREFLELWSGADPDLPPVLDAQAAVARLADAEQG